MHEQVLKSVRNRGGFATVRQIISDCEDVYHKDYEDGSYEVIYPSTKALRNYVKNCFFKKTLLALCEDGKLERTLSGKYSIPVPKSLGVIPIK